MTRGIVLVPVALLGLTGCFDSVSATDDSGIVIRLDGSSSTTDGGRPPPPPPGDSGLPGDAGPPPPPEDGGGPITDGSIPTTPGNVGAACGDDADCTGLTNGTCQTMVGGGGFGGGLNFPGGYCSAECTPGGSECGPGGECFSVGFGGFGFSLCAKRCNSDADCRTDEGYTCTMPPFIGGGPYCLPPTPGGPGGDGGFPGFDGGFPGGDGGFPGFDGGFPGGDGGFPGFDGGFPDGGFFPDAGTTDAGGPTVDAGSIPTIPGNVGSGCTGNDECTGLTDGRCETNSSGVNFPGGYCSASCTPGGSECGEGGVCFAPPFVAPMCAKRCVTDADCRTAEGYTCTDVGTGDPVCTPPF